MITLSVCLGIIYPSSAVYRIPEHDNRDVYYVDQEIWESDLQRQINEVLIELNKNQIEPYGRDPDANDYYTEIVTVDRKTVKCGGFAGNQNPGGVCFGKAGGAFFWNQASAKATGSASVNFSVPLKAVSVNFDFGGIVNRNSSSIAYIKNVTSEHANHYVKLYVTETKIVEQVNYYKTNKKTEKRVALLTTAYPSTLYSQKFDVKVVGYV